MNKGDKILITLFVLAISLVLFAVGMYFRQVEPPVRLYNAKEYYTALNILETDYEWITQKTNEEYKDLVEDKTRLGLYFYREKDMGDQYNGMAFVAIRTIVLDDELEGEEYCMVFTHEAMHIKKFSGNETYICFETFKFLYESEDEYLHNVGVWYGIRQLHGYYGGEYNCHDLIIDYLVRN